MADQESLDYMAHYDPVAGEIVEPLNTITLDTLNVREITCFKINLDEIVDADADENNGVTFEGDLFMADNSTAQLATVQGVAGAPIDYLDDINFDTDSGVKFGAGTKLSDYEELTLTGTWGVVTVGPVFTPKVAGTIKFMAINNQVTMIVPTFPSFAYAGVGNITFSVAVPDAWLPASYSAATIFGAQTALFSTAAAYVVNIFPSVVTKQITIAAFDSAVIAAGNVSIIGTSVTYLI